MSTPRHASSLAVAGSQAEPTTPPRRAFLSPHRSESHLRDIPMSTLGVSRSESLRHDRRVRSDAHSPLTRKTANSSDADTSESDDTDVSIPATALTPQRSARVHSRSAPRRIDSAYQSPSPGPSTRFSRPSDSPDGSRSSRKGKEKESLAASLSNGGAPALTAAQINQLFGADPHLSAAIRDLTRPPPPPPPPQNLPAAPSEPYVASAPPPLTSARDRTISMSSETSSPGWHPSVSSDTDGTSLPLPRMDEDETELTDTVDPPEPAKPRRKRLSLFRDANPEHRVEFPKKDLKPSDKEEQMRQQERDQREEDLFQGEPHPAPAHHRPAPRSPQTNSTTHESKPAPGPPRWIAQIGSGCI